MRSRGLKLTLIAGLGVAGVGGAAVIQWREFGVQYHLARLRREPDYLLKIVERPEGSLARAAVQRFIETPQGKESLFRAVMVSVFEESFQSLLPHLRKSDRALFWLSESRVSCSWGTEEANSHSEMLTINGQPPSQIPRPALAALKTLLPSMKGRGFRVPAFPDHQFSIVDEAQANSDGKEPVALKGRLVVSMRKISDVSPASGAGPRPQS